MDQNEKEDWRVLRGRRAADYIYGSKGGPAGVDLKGLGRQWVHEYGEKLGWPPMPEMVSKTLEELFPIFREEREFFMTCGDSVPWGENPFAYCIGRIQEARQRMASGYYTDKDMSASAVFRRALAEYEKNGGTLGAGTIGAAMKEGDK